MARNLLPLLGFCFSIFIFHTNAKPPQEQMRVSTTTMQAVPFVPSVKILGSVVAKNEIAITPALTQLVITDVLVEEGDYVKQGQILATLETPIQDEKVKRAQAELEKALALIKQNEAMNNQAQSELKRAKPLSTTGVISASEFDKFRMEANSSLSALNAAKAEYRQLQAQLAEEKTQRAKTTIIAPKDGVISERVAISGMITDDNPLFKLIENNQYEFSAEAYISNLKQVNTGSPAVISLTEGDKITGKVRYISPKIDPITQIGKIRISLENVPKDIKLGDFGSALFQLKPETINTIPYSAANMSDKNKASVFVVGKDNVVEKKQIITGRVFDNWIEIKSGLSSKDKVIVSASPFLQEMDTVSMTSQEK
ncbi:efflux RND transporter periplasmic adaptor subunit [Xenorhabdus sp. Reich]|uniref:Efflux RND transporter periplasmic adaptor subunit n=1 Tax=Xenorhabdus littoralis TaxID=2582835 RepID=A0ABU4SPX7_9GAMM|nr:MULTISPECIES: efflux RND transporter periplasmic adaptor subunit [unclassified Xenorhabdus]MDX7993200.1 efflux RND transporter periplasmic adaptor subunit [Xenorhabdus sp. psl]MDX8000688.1 efflux RND transporter periplasmic adaptor subunit [Xenorhabdus sp. Reich]